MRVYPLGVATNNFAWNVKSGGFNDGHISRSGYRNSSADRRRRLVEGAATEEGRTKLVTAGVVWLSFLRLGDGISGPSWIWQQGHGIHVMIRLVAVVSLALLVVGFS